MMPGFRVTRRPAVTDLPGIAVLALFLGLLAVPSQAGETAYVALDAKGKPVKPQAGARPHACVLDTASGLVWEVKTDNSGPGDKDWTYTWYDGTLHGRGSPPGHRNGGRCAPKERCDTEGYVAATNKRGLCGFRDWRLPTAAELEGLLRPTAAGAQIDARFFPNTPATYFWTGHYLPTEVGGALMVNFGSGMTLEGHSAGATSVRLVRGPGKH